MTSIIKQHDKKQSRWDTKKNKKTLFYKDFIYFHWLLEILHTHFPMIKPTPNFPVMLHASIYHHPHF